MDCTAKEYEDRSRQASLRLFKRNLPPAQRMYAPISRMEPGIYVWSVSGQLLAATVDRPDPRRATADEILSIVTPDIHCRSLIVPDRMTMQLVGKLLSQSNFTEQGKVLNYLSRQVWSPVVVSVTDALTESYWLPSGMAQEFSIWRKVFSQSGEFHDNLIELSLKVCAQRDLTDVQYHFYKKLSGFSVYKAMMGRSQASSLSAYRLSSTQSALWSAVVATDPIAREWYCLDGASTKISPIRSENGLRMQFRAVSPTKLRVNGDVIIIHGDEWGIVTVHSLSIDCGDVIIALRRCDTRGVSAALRNSGTSLLHQGVNAYLVDQPFTSSHVRISGSKWRKRHSDPPEEREVPLYVKLAAID